MHEAPVRGCTPGAPGARRDHGRVVLAVSEMIADGSGNGSRASVVYSSAVGPMVCLHARRGAPELRSRSPAPDMS
jgi:hypothetical protein